MPTEIKSFGQLSTFANFDKNDKGYFATNAQNVHRSAVQSDIKQKYQEIKQNKSNNNTDEIVNEIVNEIINYTRYLNKDYIKIKDIIMQIIERNSFVKNINATETEVLVNSWGDASDIVKENIIIELLDITDGKLDIVCPTGVTSRIINADIVEQVDQGIKESDIRQEMLNTASKIRGDLEKKTSYQNLQEEDQKDVFKQKLLKKYKKDYKGVVSDTYIIKELNTWFDEL
jgi:hypothetical protein